jgi:hypothetical protein
MICPKCGAEQGEEKQECTLCGVIFAKLAQEDFDQALPEIEIKASGLTPEDGWASTIKGYLLVSDQEENPLIWAGRVLVYLILFIWGWKFIATPMASDYFAETFLHGVNLAFHESGHVIFGFFGSLLGQVVMPLICLGTFLFYRNPFAASVTLWWTGQSFMDLGPYINDARALQLPLLGGNIGSDNPDFHDWHHLLRDIGLLKYDHTLAVFTNHIGILLMLISFVWGGYLLYRQCQTIHLGKLPC